MCSGGAHATGRHRSGASARARLAGHVFALGLAKRVRTAAPAAVLWLRPSSGSGFGSAIPSPAARRVRRPRSRTALGSRSPRGRSPHRGRACPALGWTTLFWAMGASPPGVDGLLRGQSRRSLEGEARRILVRTRRRVRLPARCGRSIKRRWQAPASHLGVELARSALPVRGSRGILLVPVNRAALAVSPPGGAHPLLSRPAGLRPCGAAGGSRPETSDRAQRTTASAV
jgi:hypothetical protein